MFGHTLTSRWFVVLLPLALAVSVTTTADTFNVTASSCRGAGSITEAIEAANNNPGPDTIEFDADLSVTGITAGSCGTAAGNDPSLFYLASVSDDLTINGNGATLRGAPFWVTADGLTNVTGACPADLVGGAVVAEAPGFLRIETGSSVIIDDLTIEDLSAFYR